MIAGICGGIAQFLGMDPSIVRLGAGLIAFFSVAAHLLVYLGLLLLIPEEPLSAPEPAASPEEA